MSEEKSFGSKAAIIEAAADLFHLRGVAATSVNDILRQSGTGKSQFYYYFDSKEQLVHRVLAFQFERYVASQQPFIDDIASWAGIRRWLDAIADQFEARELLGGCPIGSLAAEMNDRDDSLRRALASAFDHWEAYLERGLGLLQQKKSLSPRADLHDLTEFVMAAIQGGYLLASTRKDIQPMRNALRGAYLYLRSYKV